MLWIKNKLKTIYVLILVGMVYGVFFHKPHQEGAREIAHREVLMWKAYYKKNYIILEYELLQFLRHYYGITFWESFVISRPLTKAAVVFQSRREEYRDGVLPFLIKAYGEIKSVKSAGFDPQDVAEAELEWWVARRTKGENSPQQVGKKIADLYSKLYQMPADFFLEPGVLRAAAADLRDRGGDWNEVEEILVKSYQLMEATVEGFSAKRNKTGLDKN